MEFEISGKLTRESLIELLNIKASKEGYCVIEDSIDWDPTDANHLVEFDLRPLTDNEREQMDMDTRPAHEQIKEDVIFELYNIKDDIEEKIENIEVGSTNYVKNPTEKSNFPRGNSGHYDPSNDKDNAMAEFPEDKKIK